MLMAVVLGGLAIVAAASLVIRHELASRSAAAGARRQARMLELVHDALIVWRVRDGIVFWNNGAEALYGWSAEQALGRHVHELLRTRFPEDLTGSAFDKHLEQRGQWSGELEHTRSDGKIVVVESRMTLMREGELRPVVVESNYDITEQRRAERAQERSEARARSVVETAADAIITIDIWGKVQTFNPAAERLFGYRADEVIGSNISLLMPEPYRSEHDRYLARYHQTGEPHVIGIGREVIALRKDGSVFPADLAVGEVRDHEHVFTGILRDISGKKAAEAEREELLAAERAARADAERSARLKDEFLAAVSHELRTPLTAILGWAGMLNRGGLDEKTRAQALEAIERNARGQSTVVEDLLDVSRIIAGKMRLEAQPASLSEAVESAIGSVLPAAAAKHIQIDKDLGCGEIVVVGDPDRLTQIAWNLLSNAVKFTPNGGTVRVAVRRGRSTAEIEVSDTGIGFAPSFAEHLFERFQQADKSTARSHQRGLGLGLSLVRHLTELHGGSVRAMSAGEGRGATFVVCLPLPALGEQVATAPREVETRLPLAGVSVLVVDDEEDVRVLISRMLESSGARVVAVATAAEALETVKRSRPSAVVADLGMPEMDGYALARALRALSPQEGGETPAAALTAFAREDDRRRALGAGYQLHLAKPIDAGRLIKAVMSLVQAVPA